MKSTPEQVVRELIEAVPARQWNRLPSLYAEDAVVEQPLALPQPVRLAGREAIAQHFAGAAQLPLELRAVNVVLHGTTDEEVIVAEFDYEARITTTGSEFRVPNIFVVRVRDGKILCSRDYSNHAMFAVAFNRMDDVTAQLMAVIR